MLKPEQILRLGARPVPRYTSYPTAPHFHAGIGQSAYRGWMRSLPAGAAISLYLHIPFCDTLCWFCGCHTKITRQYAPVAAYLETLIAEIGAVAGEIPEGVRVTHIHWGGGSPTILAPQDILRLAGVLRGAFPLAPDAEFAVEVDPRGMTDDIVDALVDSGLSRVSIGVQDFDPAVQAAINRRQSVEETRRVVAAFRMRGVASLNIDAIYGLPGQHEAQLLRTLSEVVRLAPDRVALFGYAHVPWMKRHQTMISTADLPMALERYGQAGMAAEFLFSSGFSRVGLDHFALPSDTLAIAARQGSLRRNFQGYTAERTDAVIGLGASAIGQLPQCFVQNDVAIGAYQRRVRDKGFATVRGLELSGEDRARARVIEQLMCAFSFSARLLDGAAPALAAEIEDTARRIVASDRDGLVEPTPDGFVMTQEGRPFVRTIAAEFDAYLRPEAARHSMAV